MSARFSALPPDAMQDRRLLEVDLAVLNDLGRHADVRTGWCFRAQRAMAEEVGVSRRTAQRSLDRLLEYGYLEREARMERGKGQKSNLYRILFEIASRRGQLDMFEDLPEEKEPRKVMRKASSVTHPPRHARGVNGAP